jgi:transcriptional regulator with XRE-family HTH domain
MTISDRLKQEREKLGFSQSSAGELVGVTKQTFIQWEKGKSYPDAHQITLLLENGFDVSYILTGNLPIEPLEYVMEPMVNRLSAHQGYMTERERLLLENFNFLSDEQKNIAEAMIMFLKKHKLKING